MVLIMSGKNNVWAAAYLGVAGGVWVFVYATLHLTFRTTAFVLEVEG